MMHTSAQRRRTLIAAFAHDSTRILGIKYSGKAGMRGRERGEREIVVAVPLLNLYPNIFVVRCACSYLFVNKSRTFFVKNAWLSSHVSQ